MALYQHAELCIELTVPTNNCDVTPAILHALRHCENTPEFLLSCVIILLPKVN